MYEQPIKKEGGFERPFKMSYEKVEDEESLLKYEQAAEGTAKIMKEISALSVPKSSVESWKKLMSLLYRVDDYIDHMANTEERQRFLAEAKSFLRSEDFSSEKNGDVLKIESELDKLTKNLTQAEKDFFLRSLNLLLRITEEIKIEKDPKRVVKLTLLEGQISSRLFLPFLTEDFRESNEYHKLVRSFALVGRMANSFDTMVDLSEDHKNNQLSIEPTYMNRVLFFGSVVTAGASFVREAGVSKKLIQGFFKGTKKVIGDTEKI